MLLRIEATIRFPSVGHIYYEVPDKSVVDDAQQMIAELCHQKLHGLYGDSDLGQERLNRELNNMAETGTAFRYLLLKDIIDRSRTENAPMFSYDPGSLILFLLGATPVNPLPPHYRCGNCGYVEEVSGIKDGYDFLQRHAPSVGTFWAGMVTAVPTICTGPVFGNESIAPAWPSISRTVSCRIWRRCSIPNTPDCPLAKASIRTLNWRYRKRAGRSHSCPG